MNSLFYLNVAKKEEEHEYGRVSHTWSAVFRILEALGDGPLRVTSIQCPLNVF